MKIVRHVARDMRQAMRAIRERLGEDAVILSSRRTSDGVEVTAAIDFDAESLDSAPVQPLVDTPESPLLRREAHPARSEAAYTVPGREGAHVRETEVGRDYARDSAPARDTAHVREASRLDAALTRRETPPIRDQDKPVHSKVPPHFDERPTHEPAPTTQRFDADPPLISRELQAALLDSLVVREEEPSRAAAPAAAHAKSAATSHCPHVRRPLLAMSRPRARRRPSARSHLRARRLPPILLTPHRNLASQPPTQHQPARRTQRSRRRQPLSPASRRKRHTPPNHWTWT